MALTHSSTISSGPGHTPAGGKRSKGKTGSDKLNKMGWGAERVKEREAGWTENTRRIKPQGLLVLTDPSEALAPTLSPAAFQQTSKMPPVPL